MKNRNVLKTVPLRHKWKLWLLRKPEREVLEAIAELQLDNDGKSVSHNMLEAYIKDGQKRGRFRHVET